MGRAGWPPVPRTAGGGEGERESFYQGLFSPRSSHRGPQRQADDDSSGYIQVPGRAQTKCTQERGASIEDGVRRVGEEEAQARLAVGWQNTAVAERGDAGGGAT